MEFKDVMKIRKRMCLEVECTDCALKNEIISCNHFMNLYPDKAEKILIEWDKQHPIKTNLDVFCETFGFKKSELGIPILDENECIFFCNEGVIDCEKCELYRFWHKEYKKQ